MRDPNGQWDERRLSNASDFGDALATPIGTIMGDVSRILIRYPTISKLRGCLASLDSTRYCHKIVHVFPIILTLIDPRTDGIDCSSKKIQNASHFSIIADVRAYLSQLR